MGLSLSKAFKSVTSFFNPKTYYDGAVNLLDQTKYGADYGVGMSALGVQSPWSSVVSGAVGLGQDILSGWWNTNQQTKLNKNAFEQNLLMWNLQNAYNDPSAQMQRLARAGLNPNLVYGGGNVTGNTTSNYPTYEAVKYSGVGSFLNRNQQKQIALAQLDLGMKEFQQRVTNQSINNGIALEKLELYRKINQAMLRQYGETTRGKKLMNDFFETPLEFKKNENGEYDFNSQQLGMLLKIFLGAMHS